MKSTPGNLISGMPNQLLETKGSASKMPSSAATITPAITPKEIDQGRKSRGARRTRIAEINAVDAATVVPANEGAFSGTVLIRLTAKGRVMAAMRINTVPATVGVMTLRRTGSHNAMAQ